MRIYKFLHICTCVCTYPYTYIYLYLYVDIYPYSVHIFQKCGDKCVLSHLMHIYVNKFTHPMGHDADCHSRPAFIPSGIRTVTQKCNFF